MADNASGHSRPDEHAGEGGGATGTTGSADMTGKTSKAGKAVKGNGARGGKTRGKGGRVWSGILAVILVIGGIAVFAYPSVADMLATREHTEVIDSYQKKTAAMPSGEDQGGIGGGANLQRESERRPHDPFVSDSGYVLPTNYTSVLNVNHDGVMGYLSINRISLNYSSTTAPPKTCSLKVWGI